LVYQDFLCLVSLLFLTADFCCGILKSTVAYGQRIQGNFLNYNERSDKQVQ